MPITILELARFRAKQEVTTGEDFERVGLQIMGGCQGCGATLGCYNAYPSRTGFWRCEDCIGDSGFESVEEANDTIFGGSSAANMRITIRVTPQELDMIIASLRLWQDEASHIADGDGMIANIAEDNGEALSDEGIDALIERINVQPKPPAIWDGKRAGNGFFQRGE